MNGSSTDEQTYECGICSWVFTPDQPSDAIRLPCSHTYCGSCLATHYSTRQARSTMRIALLPCPKCRLSAEVPAQGVTHFPSPYDVSVTSHADSRDVRVDDIIDHNANTGSTIQIGGDVSDTSHNFDQRNRSNNDVIYMTSQHNSADSTDSHLDSPLTGKPEVRFLFPSTAVDDDSWMEGGVTDSNNNLRDTCRHIDQDMRAEDKEQQGRQMSLGTDDDDDCDTPTTESHPSLYHTTSTGKGRPTPTASLSSSEPNHPDLLGTYSPRWQIVKHNHELPVSLLVLPGDWSPGASPTQAVIAEYGASRVNLIDDTGEPVTTISGLKPFSLAHSPSGYLLIGDRRSKSILALNSDGEEAYRWESGCFPWIGGIACLRGGNVVVYDRDWARIGIYSPEGEKIHVFGSYGSAGDDQTCMADFLTVDQYNRIIVSDSANHRVKIFDETGELLTVFGGRGSKEGRLNWPRGVCTNERGEILIVDSMNERVVLYAGSGKYIGTAMDEVERPYGLGYGKGGMVGLTQHRRAGWSQTSLFQVLP